MLKKSRAPQKRPETRKRAVAQIRTLAIDIGGSGLKASVLDEEGTMLTERVRVETPPQCPPELMIETLARLVAGLPGYDRVSVGFPGVIRNGKVLTAHNLGKGAWHGFALDQALSARLGKPVRVLNDADIQGLGAIRGEGVEVVITLGTGLGSSLFEDGRLAPHLEFAHHPFRNGETYEEQLGNAALELAGKRKWRKRVLLAIETLRDLTTFDHLYIGGGNAELLGANLPPGVSIVPNNLGIRGGIWLWRERTASNEAPQKTTVRKAQKPAVKEPAQTTPRPLKKGRSKG